LLGEKVIVCKFDSALYITHRLACIADVMKEYAWKVPEEMFDEWRRVARSENVDEIEAFIGKLERILGITILTLPRVDP